MSATIKNKDFFFIQIGWHLIIVFIYVTLIQNGEFWVITSKRWVNYSNENECIYSTYTFYSFLT